MAVYHRLNYALRVGKQIERKMMLEALQRLSWSMPLRTFRYIGFGSLYFADFILFHKAIGFREMISIERAGDEDDRFRFNVPYSAVTMRFGESGERLPEVIVGPPCVAWLDYECKVSPEVLADVNTFASGAAPGSILIVTLCVSPATLKKNVDRLQELTTVLGEEAIPETLTNQTQLLDPEEMMVSNRRIVGLAIDRALENRNYLLARPDRLAFRQFLHIRYRDGLPMATVAGVIDTPARIAETFERSHLEGLDFVKAGDEFVHIEPPNLTLKEIRHLNGLLPHGDPDTMEVHGIPRDIVRQYVEYYRYWPTYVEADL